MDGKEVFTGYVTFREVEFSYVFSEGELKLIAPIGKSRELHTKWFMDEIAPGTYTSGDPMVIEESELVGTCNETGGRIVFLIITGSYVKTNYNLIGNGALILQIDLCAYIVCKNIREHISRISFSGPDINYIHPVNKVISLMIDDSSKENGVFTIQTNDFSTTTTGEQTFYVNSKQVNSKFGITRGVSMKIGDEPLSIKSSLMFEFDPTNEYEFILSLCRIAKDYISFLCYRRNTYFEEIELSSPSSYADGKYENFAQLYILGERFDQLETALKRNRFIKQYYVRNVEGKILQDIADNKLYLRHLPSSYESGRHIDAARFVMIVAAFEWEFDRMCPDGLQKSESRKEAEKSARLTIDELIESRKGKEKDIYKFLRKLVGAASLENKIVSACEKLNSIIEVFGKRLYSLNHEELIFADMGKRLADQRNHYAHGDINKDFIGLALLDLIFLEDIIYAMQLKYYGTEEEDIRKAINDLFQHKIAL